MSMFNKGMKIGEGQKYDVTQVSKEGLSAEDIAKMDKAARKLIDIYNTDGKAGLSQIELAIAMDEFSRADIDCDGKVTDKELEEYAKKFNKENGLSGDAAVTGKDLKAFAKAVRKYTKGDEKVSTETTIVNDDIIARYVKNHELTAVESEQAQEPQAEIDKIDAEAENERIKQAEKQAEEQRQQDLKNPKEYTVQLGDSLTSILKRSLEAQGKVVNEENLAQAKKEFIDNNPGVVHKNSKGVEYLYGGDVVKIAGNLEDKANSDEIRQAYKTEQNQKKAAAQKPEKSNTKINQKQNVPAESPKSSGDNSDIKVDWWYDVNGRQERFVHKKNGDIIIYLYTPDKKTRYIKPNFVAEQLGLKKVSFMNNVYQSEYGILYKWNDKNYCFECSDNIEYSSKNGKVKFDKGANPINQKGYKLNRNGSVTMKKDNGQIVNFTFHPSGRIKKIKLTETNGKKHEINYADKEYKIPESLLPRDVMYFKLKQKMEHIFM